MFKALLSENTRALKAEYMKKIQLLSDQRTSKKDIEAINSSIDSHLEINEVVREALEYLETDSVDFDKRDIIYAKRSITALQEAVSHKEATIAALTQAPDNLGKLPALDNLLNELQTANKMVGTFEEMIYLDSNR